MARGILCTWLVCLALWTAERTTGDAVRCILILWCLFAFIACGFEHSIANMTIFATVYLSGVAPTLGLGAIFHNLLRVSLGNAVAGAFVLAFGYTVVIRPNRLAISRRPAKRSVPPA